ncbi:hypothetical protein ASE06_04195 [Sphingopyxis sp. Root214]|jgi:hypothetical protein|uniref:hypothetical protein n=1 Tax=unclassified Sphingopyxis TaxID=2614943 RepID=UPI0006F6E57E|nr:MULTISPECIES: hypothetical protein [unclassified Sphingopyxis]KQZ77002.1 hypothetical protein ASD73_03800 [Sphingopyxis sp. Root154]KRC09113.1 hypothetical protein ASE06_04195 [Sphingopyxis sp. Root214]
MKKWHETPAANIGLRASGILLLGIGWLLALRLHNMAMTTGPRDPGALMILLSAATFLGASAGSALLFVGPGLWEAVEVSERWRRLSPPDSNAPFFFESVPEILVEPPTRERTGA